MELKIKRNRIKCLACNDIIESKYSHDFVKCKCGNVHVDGGREMLKRGFEINGHGFEDLSEYFEENEHV